jgi:hypothetical protein
MSDCGTCDIERGILCIDCYHSTDDDVLPAPYAEYFAWAAWYPKRRKRRPRLGIGLAALLTCACLLAAAPATTTDEQLREDFAALRAKTDTVNAAYVRLREARRCAESGFLTDLSGALERAKQAGQASGCTAFSRE